MKICITCKIDKPLSDFPPNKNNKDGFNRKCRICYNEYMRLWYDKNKEIHKARVNNSRQENPHKVRASKYKISEQEVSEHLSTPCDICGEKATCIDHDHLTGVVRGGLCFFCNSGLGMFKDNTALLEKAIQYLKPQ